MNDSKSAVATTRFTVEDIGIQALFKMFAIEEWSVDGLETLTEQLAAVAALLYIRIVVDHTLPPNCKDII